MTADPKQRYCGRQGSKGHPVIRHVKHHPQLIKQTIRNFHSEGTGSDEKVCASNADGKVRAVACHYGSASSKLEHVLKRGGMRL